MNPAQRVNEHGQPVGEALPDWAGAHYPDVAALDGTACRVERLDPLRHAPDLFKAFGQDRSGAMWTYLSDGPFASQDAVQKWLEASARQDGQVPYAIVPAETGRAAGVATFMRIQPADGVVEVGGIALAPPLQKTRAATEAMFLMMQYAFEACGYRRYEWKCDALNAPSRRAAERLGFTYDGLFRQAVVYRGRSRDTAWYSILDKDWPVAKRAFEAWLAPENFDAAGRQKRKLADLRAE